MSDKFSDTAATLRRRYRAFIKEGYPDDFCHVFLKAAEEVGAFKRLRQVGDTQLAVELLADNQRLRRAMKQTFDLTMQAGLTPAKQREILRPIGLALTTVKPPGQHRLILAIDVSSKGITREIVEANVKNVLDQHDWTGGASAQANEEDQTEQAPQPESAGRDVDQRGPSEDAGGDAGAADLEPGRRSEDEPRVDDQASAGDRRGGEEAGTDDLPAATVD